MVGIVNCSVRMLVTIPRRTRVVPRIRYTFTSDHPLFSTLTDTFSGWARASRFSYAIWFIEEDAQAPAVRAAARATPKEIDLFNICSTPRIPLYFKAAPGTANPV